MKFASLRRIVLIVLSFALVPAHAQVAVNKGFNPISASVGQTSTLTIQLLNAAAVTADNTAVTDNLPAGVIVDTPLSATTDCGAGIVTAAVGATSVSLSNGTIPAATGAGPGSCTITVNVVSNSPGSYTNTIPANAVSSSQGTDPEAASATFTVIALSPVTATKSFSPANVHGDGKTTLTITLPNNNALDLTNVAFTDVLPAQLIVATPNNLSTTCTPGTANGASGAASVGLTGATIPAGGSCTVTVDVTPVTPNNFFSNSVTNTVAAGNLTSDQGVSNTVFSAPIQVQTGAQVAKAFAASPIANGASSTFTITIRNFNAVPLTPVSFTDNVPAGITPTAVATTCAGAATSFTATSVTVTGGTVPAAPAGAGSTSCTVTVTYTASNAGSAPVTVTNSIPASNFGGVNFNTANANLTINPTSVILATKSFTGNAVQTGALTLTITLNNSSATAATITSFTDDLATMGAGFTVGSSPPASTTCGGMVTATPATTLITMVSTSVPPNMIPAAGSCTITVPVAIAGNAPIGNDTNRIPAGNIQTDQGNNLVPVSATVNVKAALAITKSFSPTLVAAGQNSLLTITVTRTANAAALTNLSFSDTLPTSAFAAIIAASPAPTNTCGGTLTAASGTNVISLAGGTLSGGAAATSCAIGVTVTAPNGSNGISTNTIPIGNLTTAELASNPTAATATLTASNTTVSLGKGFNPITVPLGSTSNLSLQILNDNPGALALTGVSLLDTLPAGMTLANPANPTFTGAGCSGATITGNPGAGTLQITGATINANAVCTLAATVIANAAGNLINTLQSGALISDQGLSNVLPASATVAASGSADLVITKDDGVTQATPGGSVTYTIVASNTGPNDVAGASVIDNPPAGVTFTSWTCAAGSAATCPASGTGAINALVSISSGSNVTFQVTAAIASSATGTITNTVVINPPGTVVDTNPTNNTATDTDTLVPGVDLSVNKTGPATVTAGQPISYSVVAHNAGPSDSDGALFSDPVPVDITAVTATCNAATGGAVCGTVSSGNNVASTITKFPVGGSVTFTISGTAPVVAPDTLVNTATITPAGGITDLNPNDNSSTATTIVSAIPPAQADVAVIKTGPAKITAGQNIVYSISVTNNGPDQADGVSLADPAPSGLTFVAADAPCATGFPCSLGSLTVGQTVVIGNVTFSTAASIAGTIVNTATVTSTTLDPNTGNNSSTVDTTVSRSTVAAPAPIDARWAMLLLITLLGWIGMRIARRRED